MSESIVVAAYSVADVLNLRRIRADVDEYVTRRYGSDALFCEIGERQFAFIFLFGSIVFFNVSEDEQELFLERIEAHTPQKSRMESEEFIEDDCLVEFHEGLPKVQFNKVALPTWDLDLFFVLARVIGQSCRLEILEKEVEEVLRESGELTRKLQTSSWRRSKRHDIQRSLGTILQMRHDMIYRLRLLHEPEITWVKEHCDQLYQNLLGAYELPMRFANIDKMLAVASESAELQLSMLDTRRGEFLELIIILLIVVEVIQTLFDALIL